MLCQSLTHASITWQAELTCAAAAVRRFLGPNYVLFCGVIQHLNLVRLLAGHLMLHGAAGHCICALYTRQHSLQLLHACWQFEARLG